MGGVVESVAAGSGLAAPPSGCRPRASASATGGRSRPWSRRAPVPGGSEVRVHAVRPCAGHRPGPARRCRRWRCRSRRRSPGHRRAGPASRLTCTGAAQTRFCVNTPAAAAGRSRIDHRQVAAVPVRSASPKRYPRSDSRGPGAIRSCTQSYPGEDAGGSARELDRGNRKGSLPDGKDGEFRPRRTTSVWALRGC